MENNNLAIKGHPTRGKEVIEILEMLGGKNKFNFRGNEDVWLVLNGNIQRTDILFAEKGFTLEEFLEKYPYKVGDKVQGKGSAHCDSVYIVEDMIWEKDHIDYIIRNQHHEYPKFTVTVEYLQPYKEEDNTNIHINPDIDNKTTCDIKINGMQVNINDYTVKSITKTDDGLIVEYIKNKQYPKTYQECCDVLDIYTVDNEVMGYNNISITLFQQLLICRDAYWKIAGEEMKLYEPWEPDWNNNNQFKFLITRWRNDIIKEIYTAKDCILAFPTEEMRDAFFENFKDLIESCKEFL